MQYGWTSRDCRDPTNGVLTSPLHAATLASKRLQHDYVNLARSYGSDGAQGGVTHGRLNVAVAEIRLDAAGIVAVIGALVAAAMAQHVAVDQESELGGNPSPGHHPLIAGDAQRRAPPAPNSIARNPNGRLAKTVRC